MFAACCFNFYYFNEIRIKENSNLEVSTFLTMEDSLFVKTGGALVLFLAFRYQISGKNKNKMFRSETDLEPVKSAS